MPDKPKMDPVTVPAGSCERCPWQDESGDMYSFCRLAGEVLGMGPRPPWCPLGTQAAIRWTPEVVGEVKNGD